MRNQEMKIILDLDTTEFDKALKKAIEDINNAPCEVTYQCNEFSGRSEQSYKDEIAKLKEDLKNTCIRHARELEQQKAYKEGAMNATNYMHEQNEKLKEQIDTLIKALVK